jgi:lytic murein transglycosylase
MIATTPRAVVADAVAAGVRLPGRQEDEGLMRGVSTRIAALAVALFLFAGGPALAAKCGGDFGTWLAAFDKEALAAGISQGTLNLALSGVTPSAAILKLDRNQHYFKQSFETYRAKRVTAAHLRIGREHLKRSAAFFAKLEKRFGVPAPILVAIWGLETGFGGGTGNTPAIRSLVTLAHDCRRSDFFTNELMAALQIVQRGDLSPAAMKGGWAGELGQTQFMPSSYVKYGIDGDGNGRVDLIHSSTDALASTANYLKGYGWQAGAPWGEGTANFQVLHKWNKADVYCRTIVWFAQQIQ